MTRTGKGCLVAIVAWAAALTLPAGPPARGQSAEGPWMPADLAERLKDPPKADADKALKAVLDDYQQRLARLKTDDPLVRGCLPRVRQKLLALAREYNQDKARYTDDCFTVEECLTDAKQELAFFVDRGLEAGKDPLAAAKGQVLSKVCWVEGANILGRYNLTVPREYDPQKPWPVVVTYQHNPDKDQRRALPYFWITSVQKGYPHGLTMVENKTRCFLKDAAGAFAIDPFRVYATGFSYGGHTDLTVAWRYPHWFAAIAPLCSDLRREPEVTYVKYLKNVPALLLHGTGDSFLASGKVVHETMKQAGCNVTFETYPGGHDGSPILGRNVKRLTEFFDKHVMDPYPRLVSHVVEHPRYSRAFWADAKLVKPGDAAATFEVRVKDANRIEIDANDQIAELDLYLCDKLVDMGKPLTVVSGGKTLYGGKPSEKLAVKLRDGADYTRGAGDALWRDILEIRKAAASARPTQ